MSFSSRVAHLFLAAFLFAVPASGAEHSEWDPLGHRYPVECRRDLSHIKATVVTLSEARLVARYEAEAARLVAAGVMRGGKAPAVLYGFVSFAFPTTIFLNADMARFMVEPAKVDRLMASILHHERCHIQMKAVTGNPQWHPTRMP